MTTTAKPRKLTSEEWDEAMSLGRARARDRFSIYSNPYDRERQSEQWHLFRFAYADAGEEVRRSAPADKDTRAAYDAAVNALTECFDVKVR